MKGCRSLPTLIRTGIFATTLVFLGGCASLTPPPRPVVQAQLQSAWLNHAERVRAIPNWQCFGRAAVRVGMKGGSISLDWQQTATMSNIRLSAPLNQGSVELRGKPDLMMITDAQGNQRYTTDPAETIYQMTGWHIPIAALPDWIRGLPNSVSAHLTWDDHGRLATLADGTWIITYDTYELIDRRVFLPTRLTLEHGDIRLRLVIERWQLDSDRKETTHDPA